MGERREGGEVVSSQAFNPAAHSSTQVSLERGRCGLTFQASLTTEGPWRGQELPAHLHLHSGQRR